MTIISAYQNGNTYVTLYGDGSKMRECGGVPIPEFPESIDIKITNRCSLGCKYCHESSVDEGRHAKLSLLLKKLRGLPPGVELAIGGGNPLTHPLLLSFLEKLKKRGLVANLTVNQKHLTSRLDMIAALLKRGLIMGLRISIGEEGFILSMPNISALRAVSSNIVYHVICGVTKVEIVDKLIAWDPGCKILVLGYKRHGRGRAYHNHGIDVEILRWARYLPRYIGKCHLSFDNLAIKKLNVKRLFTDEGWERFYMGDDGTFSMYVDAVEGVYALTSRSNNRRSWAELSVKDCFERMVIA